MIKECKVKFMNSVVAVVDCDGVQVQIPSKYVIDGIAYVQVENGVHKVTTQEEFEKSKVKKKPAPKKEKVAEAKVATETIVIDNEE